jgi:hypothetical protein
MGVRKTALLVDVVYRALTQPAEFGRLKLAAVGVQIQVTTQVLRA